MWCGSQRRRIVELAVTDNQAVQTGRFAVTALTRARTKPISAKAEASPRGAG